MSFMGGFSGLVIGVASTEILTLTVGWTTHISIASVMMSVFFSASIGLIFGLYPAVRASKLNPIQALRSD
jgi:putative ABC transport system permease protein